MKIGLTGGIGSGKSTVAGLFEACGALRFDADVVSRELTQAGGAAMAPIQQAFGPTVVAADGSLDRSAMRALVFQDVAQRLRLEAILHPMIAQQRESLMKAAGARSGWWRARAWRPTRCGASSTARPRGRGAGRWPTR